MKFVGKNVVTTFHNRYSVLDKMDEKNKDAKTTNNVRFKVTDLNTLTVQRKEDDYLG
jgi:hypothetical protein